MPVQQVNDILAAVSLYQSMAGQIFSLFLVLFFLGAVIGLGLETARAVMRKLRSG